jgi:hypothetical protein
MSKRGDGTLRDFCGQDLGICSLFTELLFYICCCQYVDAASSGTDQWQWLVYEPAVLLCGYNKIYKVSKIKMGSSCNKNGKDKKYEKNNRMETL